MFNINGLEWRVLLVSPNHPALRKDDGSWTLGSCRYDNLTIYIRDDLPNVKMKKVLSHEVTHASMFSYHVDLTTDQEELLADLLATYGQEIIDKSNMIFSRIKNKGI